MRGSVAPLEQQEESATSSVTTSSSADDSSSANASASASSAASGADGSDSSSESYNPGSSSRSKPASSSAFNAWGGDEANGLAGIAVSGHSITVTTDPKAGCFAKLCGKETPSPVTLIDNVCVSLVPGQMTMLLGPSGSGKSVLLDALAGRLSSSLQMTGQVELNGVVVSQADLTSVTGYVLQEDIMLATQTPRENLSFLARLSLPSSMTPDDRVARVNAVLSALRIAKVADTRVGIPGLQRGLSGGERKRANIAQSLVTAPRVLFVDDPTSGLDASTAMDVIKTLQDLARARNMTIIASVSQASNEIYELFDNVIALAQGRVAYAGATDGMLPFFSSLDHECPSGYNPCDFAIELLASQHVPDLEDLFGGDSDEKSASSQSGGSSNSSAQRVESILAAAAAAGMGVSSRSSGATYSDAYSGKLDAIANVQEGKASAVVKLFELFKRNFTLVLRNRQATLARVVQSVVFAVLLGALFFQMPRTFEGVNDRQGLIFMLTILLVFSGLQSAITLFVAERAVFIRESQDGLYSTATYLAAKVLADLPLQLFFFLLLAIPMYLLVGLRLEVSEVLVFFCFGYLLSIFGSWTGFALSAATGDAEASNAAAPGVVLPAVLLGGFLLKPASIWIGIRWLSYVSFMRYAFSVLLVNEFKGLTFGCADELRKNGTCPITDGQAVIDLYDAEEMGGVGVSAAVMLLFSALALLGVYFALLASKKR